MTTSYDFLDTSPVIPVIAIEAIEHAVPLAEALVAGGIVNLEITLRTQYGLDAIRLISEQVPGANVGVGTVCSADEFDAAVDAGASFVVSPGQSDELFERALLTNVPFLPGAVTATEVMAAKSAVTKAERIELYRQQQELSLTDMDVIPVVNGWVLTAHTNQLKNFKPMRTGFLKTLKDAWFD